MATRFDPESPLALGRLTDPKEVESCANLWMEKLEQAKWPRVLQAFENASFLVGNHMTRYYFHPASGFISSTFGVEDKAGAHDGLIAKCADNRLLRPCESVASNLAAIQPEGEITPANDSPEAEDGARVAMKLATAGWETLLAMPSVLGRIGMLGNISGSVYTEVHYGETDIPLVRPKYREETATNPFKGVPGEPDEITTSVPDGTEAVYALGLKRNVWTLPHIYVNPGAESLDDAQWIARSQLVDCNVVRENFGGRRGPGYFSEAAKSVTGGAIGNHPLYWWERVQDIIDTPHSQNTGVGMASGRSSAVESTQTLMTVIDVKPTTEFPRGRTAVIADRKLIYLSPKDVGARAWSERNPWRWHGYAEWGWLKLPGRFEHVALLTALVPLQKKVNAIDVLTHENRQAMALGQWLLPNHCRVPAGKPSGIPRDHVRYRDVPGLRGPERVRNEPMTADLFQERAGLIQSIEWIAGTGAINSEGVSPSAARSAEIFQFLKQERTQAKTVSYQEFQRMVELTVLNMLVEIQLHGKDGDPILTDFLQRVLQDESAASIEQFFKMSLRDHYTVNFEVVSQITRSPEAEQERAMNYLQYAGQNATPEERSGVITALGLSKFMKNKQDATVQRTRRIIARIRNDEVPNGVDPNELLMIGVSDLEAMTETIGRELLSERYMDSYSDTARAFLLGLFDAANEALQQQIAQMQQQQFQQAAALAQLGVKPTALQGGGK